MGGETTEMSATTTRVLVEAAHWDAVSDVPHRQAAQAHLRGRQAQRARRRPGDHPGRGRPGGRAARPVRRRHRRARRDRRRRAAGPAAISMASDLPARISGIDIAADTTVANLEKVGCLVGRHRRSTPRRPGAPTSPTPTTSSRRSSGSSATTRCPSVLPREAAGRGLTREQRLRRRIGRTLAGAGCVEVISFPFVGDAAFDQLGLPADDLLRHAVRLANPLSAEEPSYTTTLLPGLLRAAARNLGRGAPGRRAVRDRHRGVPGRPRPGADLRRRLAAERRRAGQAVRGDPRAAAAPGRRAGRGARARRLVGRRAHGGLVGRDRAGPPAGRRARRRGRGGLGQPDALAPGSLRPGAAWTASSSATPASCTRTCARRSGCRPAPRPSRSTSTS